MFLLLKYFSKFSFFFYFSRKVLSLGTVKCVKLKVLVKNFRLNEMMSLVLIYLSDKINKIRQNSTFTLSKHSNYYNNKTSSSHYCMNSFRRELNFEKLHLYLELLWHWNNIRLQFVFTCECNFCQVIGSKMQPIIFHAVL